MARTHLDNARLVQSSKYHKIPKDNNNVLEFSKIPFAIQKQKCDLTQNVMMAQ